MDNKQKTDLKKGFPIYIFFLFLIGILLVQWIKNPPSKVPIDQAIENHLKNYISKQQDNAQLLDTLKSANLTKSLIYPELYGKPAGNFILQTLNDGTWNLNDHKGKDIMVVIFATWCGPCMSEVPDLIKLRENLSEDEFELIAISVSSNTEDVANFIKNKQVNYPVATNSTNKIKFPFSDVQYLPTTFFIDKDGNYKLAIQSIIHYEEMFEIVTAGKQTPTNTPVTE